MQWPIYIVIGLAIAAFLLVRAVSGRKTYADILGPYLTEHGCTLVRVDIPRFYQTGPFPKVSVRVGAVQTRIVGLDTTHFEHRIVAFRDSSGDECTRWVRMLISSLGVQDIIWEPGTTEVPNKEG